MNDIARIIKYTGLFVLGMLVPFLGMLSCSERAEPLLEDPNVQNLRNQPFLIIVHDYDTMAELRKDVLSKHPEYKVSEDAVGFMARGWKADSDYDICHIYVLKPRHIEDQRIGDWGHELLHCTDGAFHKQGYRSKGRIE